MVKAGDLNITRGVVQNEVLEPVPRQARHHGAFLFKFCLAHQVGHRIHGAFHHVGVSVTRQKLTQPLDDAASQGSLLHSQGAHFVWIRDINSRARNRIAVHHS